MPPFVISFALVALAVPVSVTAGWVIARLAAAVAARRAVVRGVARLERIAGETQPGRPAERLDAAIAAVETRFATIEQRFGQRHAVSGLPTREPLLAQIAEDGRGLLGAVSFVDFDRLCAFDPALADRALLAVVERMTQMLPAGRLLAHVDRSHLAIWYGPEADPVAAGVELDAIGYALGDLLPADAGAIVPDIRVRRARFPADGAHPPALLARTLASFSTPVGVLAAGPAAPLDPAAVARDLYALEQDLRRAIERGEFHLHFQPLVDAAQGRVGGAEALIRWTHPVRGVVPPSRFVPVAEAMGMAHELGMWALNAALREAREWRRAGLGPLRVAVNVSGHQLERDDIAALVERALGRHSLGPDALEIELTEGVAMSDGGRAARLFAQLHTLGIRIAIDDFGTGYSSFSTLRTLAFDKIKIDREFVTQVDTRRDSQAICQSITALGRGLGIRVLAEGVERREEYEWLRRHGCAHFQGYYFSAPLAAAAFADFVRDADGLARQLALTPQTLPQALAQRMSA